MAFCKPSCVSPFSLDQRYFHKTLKRTIGQVSHQVSRRIKDARNRRYWEKCIVIGLQSQNSSRSSARTCRNVRNDKCIASLKNYFEIYPKNQFVFSPWYLFLKWIRNFPRNFHKIIVRIFQKFVVNISKEFWTFLSKNFFNLSQIFWIIMLYGTSIDTGIDTKFFQYFNITSWKLALHTLLQVENTPHNPTT